MIGQVFGRLTVLSEAPAIRSGKKDRRRLRCACSCGTIKTVMAQSLRSGQTRSCGCLHFTPQRHGHAVGAQTKTYRAWRDMKSRCNSPKHKSYENYGGRGITYAPEWETFDNFLADMGEAPPHLTLDRVDPNRNYTRDNCHWATWQEQAANKRRCGTQFITLDGVSKAPSEWASELGISVNTIYTRRRLGWTNPKEILHGKV